MLDNAKVVVVPGDAFGDRGEGFIRCSFATDYKKIEEALIRMENALKSF
jgi:aspartate/methionine/tyrosine aminotransferase